MSKTLDLKNYLMSSFSNPKYKNISLIYLYDFDNEYYKSLATKGKIAPEAVAFFTTKSKDVKQIRSNSEVLRNMGYESLIDKYLVEQETIKQRNLEKAHKKWEERQRKEEEQRKAEEERLRKEEEQRKAEEERLRKEEELKRKQQEENKRRKAELRRQKNKKWAEEYARRKQQYDEAHPDETAKRKSKSQKPEVTHEPKGHKESINVAGPKKMDAASLGVERVEKLYCTVYGAKEPVICPTCKKVLLAVKEEKLVCLNCKRVYISYRRYLKAPNQYIVLNKASLPYIKEQIEGNKIQLKREAEERATREQALKKWREEEEQKRKKIQEVTAKIRKLYADFDIGVSKLEEMESVLENSQDDSIVDKMHIAVRDFVIRRSVFQCRGNGHKLRNIIAFVKIFNKEFKREEISVPAGYCPICDRYFIMESTYRAIKQRGKILCRVSDEKNYLNGGDDWDFDSSSMAQESILKQCGYTVAANSWVTEEMRRAILEAIIDEGVCSVSAVLSYLEMFVNLKYGQSQYDDAVRKWESDIAYINKKYSRSPWKQYNVGSIRR